MNQFRFVAPREGKEKKDLNWLSSSANNRMILRRVPVTNYQLNSHKGKVSRKKKKRLLAKTDLDKTKSTQGGWYGEEIRTIRACGMKGRCANRGWGGGGGGGRTTFGGAKKDEGKKS